MITGCWGWFEGVVVWVVVERVGDGLCANWRAGGVGFWLMVRL